MTAAFEMSFTAEAEVTHADAATDSDSVDNQED